VDHTARARTRRAGTPADRVEFAVLPTEGDPAVVVPPWVRPIYPRRRSKPYSTASCVGVGRGESPVESRAAQSGIDRATAGYLEFLGVVSCNHGVESLSLTPLRDGNV
jgi:hypothetical protein